MLHCLTFSKENGPKRAEEKSRGLAADGNSNKAIVCCAQRRPVLSIHAITVEIFTEVLLDGRCCRRCWDSPLPGLADTRHAVTVHVRMASR